jgi:hypothetical protein
MRQEKFHCAIGAFRRDAYKKTASRFFNMDLGVCKTKLASYRRLNKQRIAYLE